MTRRLLVATAAAATVVTGTAAFAGWSDNASGSAAASSTTLSAPTGVGGNGTSKLVSWTASSTASNAPSPQSYVVERSLDSESPRVWTTACTTTGATSCTDIATVPSAPGTYTYVFRVRAVYANWHANSTESATVNYTVAPSGPNVPGTPDLVAGSDSGTSQIDNITNVTTPTFTGTITGQAGQTVHIFVDGVDKGQAAGTGSTYTIQTSALTEGAHTVTAKATLDGTTYSAANGSLGIRVDTVAPTVGAPSSTANNTNSNNKPVTGTAGTATNDVLSVTIAASLVTGTGGCTITGSPATVNGTTGNWTGVSLALSGGSTCKVTVTQTDAAGNSASNNANITRI